MVQNMVGRGLKTLPGVGTALSFRTILGFNWPSNVDQDEKLHLSFMGSVSLMSFILIQDIRSHDNCMQGIWTYNILQEDIGPFDLSADSIWLLKIWAKDILGI